MIVPILQMVSRLRPNRRIGPSDTRGSDAQNRRAMGKPHKDPREVLFGTTAVSWDVLATS